MSFLEDLKFGFTYGENRDRKELILPIVSTIAIVAIIGFISGVFKNKKRK